MTVFAIPNRPVGTQKRNVNDLVSNFDAIGNTLDAGITEDNLAADVIDADKLHDTLRRMLGLTNVQASGRFISSVISGTHSTSSTFFFDLGTGATGPTFSFVTNGPALCIATLTQSIGPPAFPAMWGLEHFGTDIAFNGQKISRGSGSVVLFVQPSAGNFSLRAKYASFDGTLVSFTDRQISLVVYEL